MNYYEFDQLKNQMKETEVRLKKFEEINNEIKKIDKILELIDSSKNPIEVKFDTGFFVSLTPGTSRQVYATIRQNYLNRKIALKQLLEKL
jgi:hypothetical protein